MVAGASRKAEQAEATRRQLVNVARNLFTTKGYAATSTEDVVRRARATRGALYHHFKTKKDLFEAVYEDVEAQLAATIAQAVSQAADPRQRLTIMVETFLDACLEPSVQRIVLIDAPAVLGWELWREIDTRHGLGLLTAALTQAIGEGLVEPLDVEALAHLLLGALNEAGLAITQATDIEHARRRYGASALRLLAGLRPTAAPPP